jgi:hypothetical protein
MTEKIRRLILKKKEKSRHQRTTNSVTRGSIPESTAAKFGASDSVIEVM